MEKDNGNDFTFCQVGAPMSQNGFETHEEVPDIGNIKIKDEASSCTTSDQTSNSGSLWKDKFAFNAPKQERVGSLSFNVINTSPQSQASQSARQAAYEGAGSSVKASLDQKSLTRKPKARVKVPFEKGYSQMDWFKLTRTHPDLAGLKGQSNRRLISLSKVKEHQTGDSMWTVLKGRVYNIAPYMKFHPGGVDFLMKAVGKDCTSMFNKYHAWVNSDFLLEKCLVGILDDCQ